MINETQNTSVFPTFSGHYFYSEITNKQTWIYYVRSTRSILN